MPIYYKVSECVNPAGAQGVDYACNREVAAGTVTIDQLAEDVSHMTSMTASDVKGIISAYIYLVYRWVSTGIQCELHGLGTFYPTLKSRCFSQAVISHPDFKPGAYITGKKLKFRPNASLKKAFKQSATFQRVSSDLLA